jgi:hypothetical protein
VEVGASGAGWGRRTQHERAGDTAVVTERSTRVDGEWSNDRNDRAMDAVFFFLDGVLR